MDPRDGRGAAGAVRGEMGDETVSTNGEPDMKEAEALAAALNRSAERVQTLWFSFLTFMLYLAVATGTTTHRMLFLESPLNLPVLNIALPLLGFYILTPIIFVVLHFYMLLNLVLLARTARTFEDALVRAFPEDGEARDDFRMRIENTLFVQLLVGGRLEREGINAKLLSLMALITLALAPVVLLLMFEIKFLPYRSEAITWLHRGLLALDLALVWTLWPGYRRQGGERLWPKKSWWLVPAGVLSAVALVYAVLVVTFPDERVYEATYRLHGSTYWDSFNGEFSIRDRPNWYAWIAPVNALDLHGEDLIDDTKLAHIEKNENLTDAERWVATFSLAKRDLTDANLTGADVRHVDFTRAILNRANLSYAWAEKAHFDGAHLQSASLADAQLFNKAQLPGAYLFRTHLQGASLFDAELQGASLNGAYLQGASLNGAQLQVASLDFAQLQGASLENAKLQGASLMVTQLKGAWLHDTNLQGVSFGYLQVPDMSQLLPGLSLDPVGLPKPGLLEAQLQGASFLDVCAWRADARQAGWKDTRVVSPKTSQKFSNQCEWTAARFADLKQLISERVPEIGRRANMERIEQRLDPAKALEGEDEMAKVWADHERGSPNPQVYEKSVAEQWRTAGCADDGAPYTKS